MIISQIAACAKNRVIGKNGDLPWDLPEDMKYFKDKTKGHIIIMGRKTFDSFKGRTLPQRLHIVISRQPELIPLLNGVIAVSSLEEALKIAKSQIGTWPEEVFIIGGGEIYKSALPFSDRIYLTEIDEVFDGDAHFPELNPNEFKLTQSIPRNSPLSFSFNTYERIR